jgi:hypothetical protein
MKCASDVNEAQLYLAGEQLNIHHYRVKMEIFLLVPADSTAIYKSYVQFDGYRPVTLRRVILIPNRCALFMPRWIRFESRAATKQDSETLWI